MKLAATRWLAGCWLFLAPAPAPAPAQIPPPHLDGAQASELLGRREAILAGERSKLLALAARLRADGKGAEADQVAPSPTVGPAADGSSRFVPLAEVVAASPKKSPGIPGREAIRAEAALALFDLAGRAATAPEPAFAFADDCLRAVLERQPDHANSRRLLGFLPRVGGWATPYAAELLARGSVADPAFGWVPADWVAHLRRGELPAPKPAANRWLPAAEADALRREWGKGWQIPTEHFEITTNVPLADAISFGRKLENLHQLFFALMADVIGRDQLPLAQRFRTPDLKPTVSKKPRHRVYYFATRAEYARNLAPFQGEQAKVSLGTYLPKKESKAPFGISYFFNDAGGQLDVTATLYHEASHQLLFESAGPDDYTQNVGNYWVFEGLGTYFETLQVEPDGSLRVGGLVGPRIAQARARLIANREFVPTEQFVGLGKARFQGKEGDGVIYLHYAEAMTLAVFLMQAREGKYREGFLDYVRDAYKGQFRRGGGRTLEARIGVRYPDLDGELLDYLAAKPAP